VEVVVAHQRGGVEHSPPYRHGRGHLLRERAVQDPGLPKLPEGLLVSVREALPQAGKRGQPNLAGQVHRELDQAFRGPARVNALAELHKAVRGDKVQLVDDLRKGLQGVKAVPCHGRAHHL